MIFNLVPTVPHVDEITQGDTINWVFLLPNYPNAAPGNYTGQMVFTLNGSKVGTPVDMTPDPANVSQWLVTMSASDAAKLPLGDCEVYTVMTQVDAPQARISVFQGDVNVLPNPMATMPPSSNQQALAAVNKTINTILSQPEQSASFNGQTYTLHNIKDLFDIRNQLQFYVNSELAALGVSHGKNYKILQDRFI